MELEINNSVEAENLLNFNDLTSQNLQDLDKSIDLEEINFLNQIDVESLDSSPSEQNEETKHLDLFPEELDLKKELEILGKDLSSDDEDASFTSDSSLDSISSDGSCIFSETFVKIRDIPIQVLAMERLEITLTDLVKLELSVGEWKSYLFEICFGLAVAQKHFGFIHNDLHSDNIMFKSTKIKEKYYQYQNKYFKVPTYGRETKIIDFARGIIKVGKRTYFSDVFKNEGDAGGQYNYLNKQKNKKFNYHFDLARLGTTIYEFTKNNEELKPINRLLILWTESKLGESFLEMPDNFSLYVKIAECASNSLPKDQINSPIFSDLLVEFDSIPKNVHIYVL